jgi:integrase
MPLKVVKRRSTGALTISGTVAGQRVRRRAQSDTLALAREEAAALEAEMLRAAWHGPKPGAHSLVEAMRSYLEAVPRGSATQARLARIRNALPDDVHLSAIDQDTVAKLRTSMLRLGAGAATYIREIIVPLRAVILHARRRGWCDAPCFELPRQPQGRTRFLLPDEAQRLIAAAGAHIRPLLLFLIGTGARMSEALELEWRDVDLAGGRAIFWKTKTGKRRVATLPPRAIAALAELPHREGHVFRSRSGKPYWSSDRNAGGQIKTAWKGAISRAGLDPELTPHDLRHTWASWHYALYRDLLALKEAGGWSTVTMVERYAHLAPAGHERAIRRFLGTQMTRAPRTVPQVVERKRTFGLGYSLGKGEVVGSIPTRSTSFSDSLAVAPGDRFGEAPRLTSFFCSQHQLIPVRAVRKQQKPRSSQIAPEPLDKPAQLALIISGGSHKFGERNNPPVPLIQRGEEPPFCRRQLIPPPTLEDEREVLPIYARIRIHQISGRDLRTTASAEAAPKRSSHEPLWWSSPYL